MSRALRVGFDRRAFRRTLLAWYRRHARDLPWRRTRDPYAIWVSEVMLQQTRVETVLPYYRRFLAEFPDLAALAAADDDAVLRCWQGLGYYGRARRLHAAARTVLRDCGGSLPRRADELRRLPGIGPYVAAAVASIAFDQPVAAVDGNVRRVLARLLAVRSSIDDPATGRRLWQAADALLARRAPGRFNQAMMELGATVCTPRRPRCAKCPVRRFCAAHGLGLEERLPVRGPRRAVPGMELAAALVQRNGRVLLVRRPDGGLLGGMWGLPAVVVAEGIDPRRELQRWARKTLGEEATVGRKRREQEHVLTHRRLRVHLYEVSADGEGLRAAGARFARGGVRWCWARPEATRVAHSALDRRLLRAVLTPAERGSGRE